MDDRHARAAHLRDRIGIEMRAVRENRLRPQQAVPRQPVDQERLMVTLALFLVAGIFGDVDVYSGLALCGQRRQLRQRLIVERE